MRRAFLLLLLVLNLSGSGRDVMTSQAGSDVRWVIRTDVPVAGMVSLGPAMAPGSYVSCRSEYVLTWCDARGGFQAGVIARFEWPGAKVVSVSSLTDGGDVGWISVVGLPGDLNNDGLLNVTDLVKLISEVIGLTSCTDDLTGDDVCNVADLVYEIGLLL